VGTRARLSQQCKGGGQHQHQLAMSSDGRAVEATAAPAAAAAAERVLEGAALLKSGAFASAIEKFDEAIALDPHSAPRQVRSLHAVFTS
jgi:Flp pilus assembly protein TadD